jgi:hypothetical protein
MTIRKNILSALALSGLFIAAHTGASAAGDQQAFKPGHGISFSAGEQHAVAYFTNDTGRCNLVVTHSGEPNWDDAASFTAIRHEATVNAGQSTRYSQGGHSFEFDCAADAEAMNFKVLKTVASGNID